MQNNVAFMAGQERRVAALTALLGRAENYVGIECSVDIDKAEYEMVDQLREEIRAALEGK